MKLSTKLILAVTLAALAVVPALSLTVYHSSRGILEKSISASQIQMARQIMDAIDRVVFRAFEGIQMIADDHAIEMWFENQDAKTGDERTFQEDIVREFEEKIFLTGPWYSICLVDAQGTVVASTQLEKIGRPIDDGRETLAYETAMRGELYYSDVVVLEHIDRPTMIFAAPVYTEKKQKRSITGAVIAHFLWYAVSQVFDEIDPASHVCLFNQEGTVIARPSAHSEDVFQESIAHLDLVRQARTGESSGSGICQGSHAADASVLAAFAMQRGYLGYRGNQWGLLIEVPLKKIFSPVHQMARNIAMLTIGVLALVAGLFYLIGKRLVRPVEALTQSVQAMAEGGRYAGVEVTTQDEIGALARAFNQMAADLNATTVSRNYLDSILRSMADMLIVTRPDGCIHTVNDAALDALGYDAQELVGRPLSDVIDLDFNHLIRRGGVSDIEKICRTKDGREMQVSFSSAIMFSDKGVIEAMVCGARDITERKRAEAAVRESERKLADIIDFLPDATFAIDSQGRVISWNRAMEAMTGVPASRMLGKGNHEYALPFYGERKLILIDLILQKDPEIEKNYLYVRREKDSLIAETQVPELRGRPVFLWGKASPIYDQNLEIVGAIESIRDITEQRQVEMELESSRKSLKNVIERSLDGILVVDEQGLVCLANPSAEAIFRRKPGSFAGKSFGVPVVIDDHTEIDFIAKDGGIGAAEMRVGETEWNGENAKLLMIRDITHRKQADEKIRTSLQEKELLLKEIHHRVKNNLQIICSLLRLQSKKILDPHVMEVFKASEGRIRSMALIHERLYRSDDLVKIDFKGYIDSLTRELVRFHEIDASRIGFDLALEEVALGIDQAVPCGLIFNELISNALKYAFPDGKKGEIFISLRKTEAGDVEMTVRDNGAGFPGNFDLKKSDSLGLYLVTMMTEYQLKGSLKFASTTRGAEFKITFKEK